MNLQLRKFVVASAVRPHVLFRDYETRSVLELPIVGLWRCRCFLHNRRKSSLPWRSGYPDL
jgi:hypothetical protein